MDQAELLQLIQDKVRSGGVGGLTLASEVRDLLTEIVNAIFAELADGASINQQQIDGLVPVDGDKTINNVKTFTTLPQSTVVPVNDEDLVNKKYVDDELSSIEVSDFDFDSNRLITRQVEGLENVNLEKTTAKDTLEELLYPIKTPKGTISGPPIHLYGDNTNAVINYSLIKTDQPITAADVNGVPIHINSGEDQEGTVNVPHNPASDSLFTLTVTSGDKTFVTTFSSKIVHPVYAGQTAKDNVVSPILNSDINGLNVYTRDDLVSVTVLANKYLIIALPEDENVPFLINGVLNNFFTITTMGLTNVFGSTSNYVVYVAKAFSTGGNLIKFLSPKL